MSVNTGKYIAEQQQQQDGDDFSEVGYRISRENDKIDSKYGFDRVKDTLERTGYLINMHSTEILDDDRRLVSALDLFFIRMDGSRFKTTVVYQPYFLVLPRPKCALEVVRFLSKKYVGQLSKIEHIQKEDLDLANHLMGNKQDYIQLWFPNYNAMIKVRREIMAAVRKTREREKSNTNYMKMLSNALINASEICASSSSSSYLRNTEQIENIIDIREYDVPYHVRVSIDLKINCGLWYNIRCRSVNELPIITPRIDILERPEPVILAYDIETTKLPLKFPDAQTDQIMMISYMIDAQGYLITNRDIISHDVADFEYTPKPEFEGNFIVFNEENELALIKKFFDHIMEIRPHIVVTYNGDFFDWPFVETRAAVYDIDMKQEIGFSKSRDGFYLCRPSMHMDCLCWVKRDSYLPVGSQGLKAVAKAKLRYDPVELDPEEMCRMAIEQPQVLSNYSVSDAVATYYLYMKYVNPFIFALTTIIPMEPDEVLRKGSGTLCETLLMVQAFHANIIFPNKQQNELNKLSDDGHVLDSETYVGGHVEALESGVFRADIPCRFRLDQDMIVQLQNNIDKVLAHVIETEENVPLSDVMNLAEIKSGINLALQNLYDIPNRLEQPVIFHLDVGAMYPNIILTNRLQPSAMVTDVDCAACDFNKPDAKCKRTMNWMWRGEMLPASKNEFQRIQQQLETEKFPPIVPNGPTRAFHELSKIDQAAYEKQRLNNYCRKAYKKTKVTRLETRCSTICQKENSFYVDTVRAFRDRRYEYKGLTKVAKADVSVAIANGDASEIKVAKGREVLYDSLQLAYKCILNSFYGYVMRRGARWHSMSMAGIVCLTGANIITKAREIIDKVGRPLELDTDGIWCILPASFPQEFTVHTKHIKKKKFNISYPNAILNRMVKDNFTNDQYQDLIKSADGKNPPEYVQRNENSIFFEVDGPYLAMVLPAAKEEGKKLKKRYAVFNFDGTLAELKGFEVKRRGELQLIKIFQSSVFESFLQGTTLEECYASVAKIADYWLDVLYSKGNNMPDTELFELISENRSMSKKLEDYGAQKSSSISTAKRLAEFLGDQMVKDAGLACKYIISRKPEGAPVTERAIPLAIFQSEISVRRHYLKRWLKDNTMGDADIRDVLDWNYYIERLGGTIQKIITIPAALQGLNNPVPRVPYPEWLHKRMLEKNDVLKQRRINEIFTVKPKSDANSNNTIMMNSDANSEENEIRDIEDTILSSSHHQDKTNGISIATKRKRTKSNSDSNEPEQQQLHKTWKEALGSPPIMGSTRKEIETWIIYQKKKWAWQYERRYGHLNAVTNNKDKQQKRFKNNNTNNRLASTSTTGTSIRKTTTIGGFLKRAQRNLIELPWQIIQIIGVGDLGHFHLWAMVGDELHKIKLYVPRKFYVNQRSMATTNDDQQSLWKKVYRILPRARPIYYLYQYSVSEQIFRDNRLGMLADLATPDIEGIYETQMSLEFRALLELGCICSVQKSEVRKLLALSTKDMDSFSIEQLEFRTISHQSYLSNDVDNLKQIFLYQHSSITGKREMWGIFLIAIKKAFIIILDTVRTNQLPSLKNLYTTERNTLLERIKRDNIKLPPDELQFQVSIEIESTIVYKQIQQILQSYRNERKTPTLLCVQSTIPLNKLNMLMPIMLDFPQTQIHIADDASLLSGLEWQRTGVRTVIRHFLNLYIVIDKMFEQCRYFHLPIGNMPNDPVLFGADLFFGRYLQKNNFILWTSPTPRPDLGGREADDSRLLAEFEDNITVVQNKPGYYDDVCVELAIDSLAISALLQTNKIQELEGASSAITFDAMPQVTLDDMTSQNTTNVLPSYDETALCSAAFRIMRTMVNGWLREVSIHRNIYSDFQIVHFYRWIRSSNSLLYDPALRRSLNNLMRKLFLQIVAEFQRLGAEIIYADFNKIIINTKKKTINDAIGYSDYIVSNIRNKELFHSVHLSYQKSWKFLLWLDTVNYSGINSGKLSNNLMATPKRKKSNRSEFDDDIVEIREEDDNDDEDEIVEKTDAEEEEEEILIELNWNIGDYLPEECQEYFETILTHFMQNIAEQFSPIQSLQKISHYAYNAVEKLNKNYGKGKNGPALQFINALCKILFINQNIVEETGALRRNMLRLIGIGEFSDMAVWKDPLNSYILNEVFCKACNHCRDIDLCRDKDVALKDGIPVWLCSQCSVYYDNNEMEIRLLEAMNRKIMSYTLQDLRCVRCKQIKRENLTKLCSCAGQFETLISANELKQLLTTFLKISDDHKMDLLKEQVEWTFQRM